MIRERPLPAALSDFLRYLAANPANGDDRVPALTDLSQELGVSVASLREQLEVARALGLVEVRPRTGIRKLPYTFKPAVRQSLAYALSTDDDAFRAYSDLRNHIEQAYWSEAVSLLTPDDHAQLRALVQQARAKLSGNPVQIPQKEHRELHLLIYRRLDNPFVLGLLEAYWEMYEAVGLNLYNDIAYLRQVWDYHSQMVERIAGGDYQAGYRALQEHMDLLTHRPGPGGRQRFE
jgi:DNA-binding FadR family transcriptional regulator